MIDPNAGREVGHHRHWLSLLTEGIGPGAVVALGLEGDPHTTSAERRSWYRAALVEASQEQGQLIFLSGDDAIAPALAALRKLRGRSAHFLMFRSDPQPGPRGHLVWATKRLMGMVIRVALPGAVFYELRSPTFSGKPKASSRRQTIYDSSATEVAVSIGRRRAREKLGLPANADIFVVIGVLGAGKHVDTIVHAWRTVEADGPLLYLVGQLPDTPEWQSLRDEISRTDRVVLIDERVDDETFDCYIQAASATLTLYRYSASSGVVLRSLTLGTPVIYGGSRSLRRDLRGLKGTREIRRISEESISEAILRVRDMEKPDPPLQPPSDLMYPTAILKRAARAKDRHS